MPAVSKAQKDLFALALAVKKGEIPAQDVSDEIHDLAKKKESELRDYAETPEKGLPQKLGEDGSLVNTGSGSTVGSAIGENSPAATPSSVSGMGAVRAPGDPGSQNAFAAQETGSGDIAATSALTDDEEDEEDELLKLKATVLTENVLTFDAFVSQMK